MTFFFINKYDRKLCTKIDFHKLIIYSSKSKLKIFAYSGGYPFSISGDIRSVPS